jgi:hypothetical protein
MARGIVISPGFRSLGSKGFQVNNEGVPELLRHSILYWDRVEWPTNNLVHLGNSPDVEFLVGEGAMTRTRIEFRGSFSGDLTPVFAQGQLAVFNQLETLEPGAWSLAQAGQSLSFPLQGLAEKRCLEAELYGVLPTPLEGVPLRHILDFRLRYSDDLHALRTYLDELYGEIINSEDQARVRQIATQRLAGAIRDVEAALAGRGVSTRRCPIKVSINIPRAIMNAVAGAYLASLNGVSIAVGAGVGAMASCINLEFSVTPDVLPGRTGPLLYLYNAKKMLR